MLKVVLVLVKFNPKDEGGVVVDVDEKTAAPTSLLGGAEVVIVVETAVAFVEMPTGSGGDCALDTDSLAPKVPEKVTLQYNCQHNLSRIV